MATGEAQSAGRTALEQVAGARADRFTGLLELELADRQRRSLAFVGGELHLPAAHPHAARWRELLAGAPGAVAAKEIATRLEQLADSWGEGAVRAAIRHPGHARLPAELVGPLPTSKLLRLAAARDPRAATELVRRFGDRRLVGSAGAETGSHVWTPEELWVLERLRQPLRFAELARDCPMPREALERAVAGLVGTGRVRAENSAPVPEREDDLRELTAGLAERIAASLLEEPLELEAEDFRGRIAALLANAGGLDHYELLGLDPDAKSDETQHAFEELARLVHPVNARRFASPDLADALQFLFERATEAYRTLTDADLRLAYRVALDLTDPVKTPLDPEARAREIREMARHSFDRALAEEANGDYHSALVLLEEVVRLEPTAERWAALGMLQARNAAWTGRAIESYRAALGFDPRSGDLRFALGELYERAGDTERALELYDGAAQGSFAHAGARAAAARLRSARAQAEAKGSGPRRLGSLFRRS